MRAETMEIPDVVKVVPRSIRDSRGYFCEVFKDAWFRENVCNISFVQDNQSLSAEKGTVRGLHFQLSPFQQGKLVRCITGALFDVAVDIRQGSPTFSRWVSAVLTAENGEQLWVPPGFAHGFATLVPNTIVHYKVTAPYSSEHDRGVRWNDPSIGIEWPVDGDSVTISDKDARQPLLAEVPNCFGPD